jgi:hypothetical protein
MLKYITFLACMLPLFALAQPKIKSSYDAAGNRIVRELTVMLSGEGEERGGGQAESPLPVFSADQVKVWPNPVEDRLNIECIATEPQSADLKAELYDANGRLLRNIALAGGSAGISVADLAPGTYFLFVRKGRAWLKWAVQKV